jgi:hypothetical protein
MNYSAAIFWVFVFFTLSLAKEVSFDVVSEGTLLELANLYLSSDDHRLYIANSSIKEHWTPLKGELQKNGTIILDNGQGLAIGKNYLYPSSNVSHFAAPFSVRDGDLLLYGHNFHAVPSGEDGIYVIGSINAAAGRPEVIEVKVAVDSMIYYDPPQYTGTMQLISVNTVPFMHHHKSAQDPVWTIGTVLFAMLGWY